MRQNLPKLAQYISFMTYSHPKIHRKKSSAFIFAGSHFENVQNNLAYCLGLICIFTFDLRRTYYRLIIYNTKIQYLDWTNLAKKNNSNKQNNSHVVMAISRRTVLNLALYIALEKCLFVFKTGKTVLCYVCGVSLQRSSFMLI